MSMILMRRFPGGLHRRLEAPSAASVAVAALPPARTRSRPRRGGCQVKAYRTGGIWQRSPSFLRSRFGTSRIDLEQEIKTHRQRRFAAQARRRDRQGTGGGLAKDDNFPHLVSGDSKKIVDKPMAHFPSGSQADVKQRFRRRNCIRRYRKGLNPDRLRLLDRFAMKDIASRRWGVGSRRHIFATWHCS